jgi:hypothetical protein
VLGDVVALGVSLLVFVDCQLKPTETGFEP